MRTILILLLLSFSAIVSAQELTESEEVTSDEWVVVFSDPRPARLQGWVRPNYGKSSGDYQSSIELERFGRKVVSKYDMELRDQWFIQSLGVYCLVVRFNDDHDETISKLKKDKAFQWVQPSNEFVLFNDGQTYKSEAELPNVITDTELPESMDGNGVVIAIIDSAVDAKHKDLAGSIKKNDDFVTADDDNNRVGEAHGTAIAGIIVTQRDTKLGVAGVSPAAKLESYRACWESTKNKSTKCNTLSLARALDAVARSDAHILNLSLSGPEDPLLDRLLQRIIDDGKMVVAAFDPTRPDSARFPSRREGVLIVRAQGLDDGYGDVFVAPGARVVTHPGNRYNFMHGHSVAAAYTSGLLALRKQVLEMAEKGSVIKADWRDISRSRLADDIVRELLQKS